jgi:dihydrodipicolinate synthase/N-acetylneuraminate lyase
VAEADAVMATGHISTDEAVWLVGAARVAGARRVLLPHPSFTDPAMDGAVAAELADAGALVEVTAYQLRRQYGGDPSELAMFVRGVGVRRCVLSSDAGQPDAPPAPEALAELIDALAGCGIDRGALEAAAGETAYELVCG